MSGDINKIQSLQANIRREAMRGTTEEALNALMAVAAEAVLTLPKSDRQKLMNVVGAMLVNYVRAGERSTDAQVDVTMRPN